MGVRGLTTYIGSRSHVYLKKYELSDTHLVIDGNSTCSQIYRLHCKCNDCFGGDYDKYAHSVYSFFESLKMCNITPIVIFDGGYEKRKLKTVMDRLKTKLKSSYNLNSVTEGSYSLFPLFLREVFKDIVLKLDIKCVRCEFEADSAIACIAKALDCPVLSYDSDFFIFDALYIPFPTLSVIPCKRYKKGSNEFTYFLQCSLYRIEYFLDSFGGMDKTKLPLLAALLGNDYMNRREFAAFYRQLKLQKGGRLNSEQQRRIKSVIKWLQNESFNSAVLKVLSRFKSRHRRNLKLRLAKALQAYTYVDSDILNYLDIKPESIHVLHTQFNIELENDNINNEGILENLDDEHSEDRNSEISSDISNTNESDDSHCLADEELIEEVSTYIDSQFELTESVTIPEAFRSKFKMCIYSPSLMDILTLNCYYFIPQIEDHARTSSHAVSLPILSAICKILRGSSSRPLMYYSRNDRCDVKKCYLETYKDNLPNLFEIEEMNTEECTKVFMKILSINDSFNEKHLKYFPPNWHLLLISLGYWICNGQVEMSAVYSVILCAVILMYVDKHFEFCRSSKQFASKYNEQLTKLSKSNKKDTGETFPSDVNKAIEEVTYKDSLFCMKNAIHYFQMDLKMRGNVKLYDKSVVHAMAEFQSCLLHIKYLNSLLKFPFLDFCISDFYDGTFIYNMIINLKKRTNLASYIKTFLCSSPTVLRLFEIIIQSVMENCADKFISCKNIRKRRRKRKSQSLSVEMNENCTDGSSNDDSIIDKNNRFALLSIDSK